MDEGAQVNTTVLWNKNAPDAVHIGVTPTSENSPLPHDGYFQQLSRYQINSLIRVLRRARDQAYGRDE